MRIDQTIRIVKGQRAYTHRQYVDVLIRNTADGQWLPFAVCWVDGRVFYIDEIMEEHSIGIKRHGCWTKRYDVRFGGYETQLYLDHHSDNDTLGEPAYTRWWVSAIDQIKRKGQ